MKAQNFRGPHNSPSPPEPHEISTVTSFPFITHFKIVLTLHSLICIPPAPFNLPISTKCHATAVLLKTRSSNSVTFLMSPFFWKTVTVVQFMPINEHPLFYIRQFSLCLMCIQIFKMNLWKFLSFPWQSIVTKTFKFRSHSTKEKRCDFCHLVFCCGFSSLHVSFAIPS